MSTSDQKLYTSPLSVCLWIDGINSRFESCLDNKSKDAEAVAQRCSVKKVFLEISQNSQENTCARASFLIKLQAWDLQLYLKKKLWHRCFPVNFVKFLRTPWLKEHLRWRLLRKSSTTKEFADLNVGEQNLLTSL